MSKNENKGEKFRRVATKRVRNVLEKLRILGNCANTRTYSYNEKQVKDIFSTIRKQVDRVEAMFETQIAEEFTLEG